MAQMTSRMAAELIVKLFEALEKNRVSIDLESCCCKEAIRVKGSDTAVKIDERPSEDEGRAFDWEISNV
jgi:hypothetical protein